MSAPPRAPRAGLLGRGRGNTANPARGRGSSRGDGSAIPNTFRGGRGRGRGNAPTNSKAEGLLSGLQSGNARGQNGGPNIRRTPARRPNFSAHRRGTSTTQRYARPLVFDPASYATYADFSSAIDARYTELKAKRAAERERAIRDGFLADPDKKVTLDKAITPVGTCTEMCPEFERVERMKQMMVESAEKVTNAAWNKEMPVEERMIKRFRRSAAGYDEQLPSDIRTPATLKTTLDYLFDEVIGNAENFASIQKFVWDRTRSIRNDFSIQQVTKAEDVAIAVECFERIARFHILSLHHLSNPENLTSGEYFDAHQEREQLNNTLLSLMFYYEDNRHKVRFKHEAEFRAYCIIFEIQTQHPDLEDRMQAWPKSLLQDGRVQTAFKLYSAAGNTLDDQGPLRPQTPFVIAQGNSSGFWRLLGSNAVSYLMACVAEIYFGQVRYIALQHVWKAAKSSPVGRRGNEDWTIDELTRVLAFDTEEQTVEFAQSFDLSFKANTHGTQYLDFTSPSSSTLDRSSSTNKQVFSRNMVEKKRMKRTLVAVANGLTVAQAVREGAVETQEAHMDRVDEVSDEDQSMFVPESNGITAIPGVKDSAANTRLNPEAVSFAPTFGLPQSIPSSIFGKTPAPVDSSTSIFGKTASPSLSVKSSSTSAQASTGPTISFAPASFGKPISTDPSKDPGSIFGGTSITQPATSESSVFDKPSLLKSSATTPSFTFGKPTSPQPANSPATPVFKPGPQPKSTSSDSTSSATLTTLNQPLKPGPFSDHQSTTPAAASLPAPSEGFNLTPQASSLTASGSTLTSATVASGGLLFSSLASKPFTFASPTSTAAKTSLGITSGGSRIEELSENPEASPRSGPVQGAATSAIPPQTPSSPRPSHSQLPGTMAGVGRTMTFGAGPGGSFMPSWMAEGKKSADEGKPATGTIKLGHYSTEAPSQANAPSEPHPTKTSQPSTSSLFDRATPANKPVPPAPHSALVNYPKTGNSQPPAQKSDPSLKTPSLSNGSFHSSSSPSVSATARPFPPYSQPKSSSTVDTPAQNVPRFDSGASEPTYVNEQQNGVGFFSPGAHQSIGSYQGQIQTGDVAQLMKLCEIHFARLQEGDAAQSHSLLQSVHNGLVQIAGALRVQHVELAQRRSSLDALIAKTDQNTHEMDALRSEVQRLDTENGFRNTQNKNEIMQALKEVSDTVATNNVQKVAKEEKIRLMQAELRAHEAELKALKAGVELENLKRSQHGTGASESASSPADTVSQRQASARSTSDSTSASTMLPLGQLAPSKNPCDTTTLENVARTSVIEQGGIMMQFVEYAAGQVIDEAINIVAAEREAEKRRHLQEEAQPYRAEFLVRKYGKRWYDTWWHGRLRTRALKRPKSLDVMSAFRKSREAKKKRVRSSQELEAIRAAAKESEEMKRHIEEENAREARAKAFAQFQEDLKKQEEAVQAQEVAKAKRRTSINSLSPGTKRAMPGTFDEDDFDFATEKLPHKPAPKRQRASTANGVYATPSNDTSSNKSLAHQLHPTSPEAVQATNNRRLTQTSTTSFRDSMHRENRAKVLQPVSDYWLLKARGIDPETPAVSHTRQSLEAKKAAEKNQRQEDLRQSQSFASSVFKQQSVPTPRAAIRHAPIPASISTSLSAPTSKTTTPLSAKKKSGLPAGVATMAADIRQMGKDFEEMRDWYRDARLQIQQESNNHPQNSQRPQPRQNRAISSSSRPSSSHSSPHSTALTDDYGREFIPGQLTYKNGYPFYPSEQLSRAEMRYRRTGGYGLCAVDPVMMKREGVEMLNARVRSKRFGKGKARAEQEAVIEDAPSEEDTEELSQNVYGEFNGDGEAEQDAFYDEDGDGEGEDEIYDGDDYEGNQIEEEYDEEDEDEDEDDGYGGRETSTPASAALQAVGATQDEPIELD